jgi:hypothetical protein
MNKVIIELDLLSGKVWIEDEANGELTEIPALHLTVEAHAGEITMATIVVPVTKLKGNAKIKQLVKEYNRKGNRPLRFDPVRNGFRL